MRLLSFEVLCKPDHLYGVYLCSLPSTYKSHFASYPSLGVTIWCFWKGGGGKYKDRFLSIYFGETKTVVQVLEIDNILLS